MVLPNFFLEEAILVEARLTKGVVAALDQQAAPSMSDCTVSLMPTATHLYSEVESCFEADSIYVVLLWSDSAHLSMSIELSDESHQVSRLTQRSMCTNLNEQRPTSGGLEELAERRATAAVAAVPASAERQECRPALAQGCPRSLQRNVLQ